MVRMEDTTQVIAGIGAGKVVQAIVRKYVDPAIAGAMLYTTAQYVKDLITAGYLRANAADTDDAIAKAIATQTGYTFAGYKANGAPGNLLGTTRLLANQYTYQAAAGQKVAPWMFPSTWLSGVVGLFGAIEGTYEPIKSSWARDNKLILTAMGVSLVGDAAVRALGVDGTVAAPSGFDISTTSPPMQFLEASAMETIRTLNARNVALQSEVAALRAASGARATGGAVIQVQEILPQKGAEVIKQRTGIIGETMYKATPEHVRSQTGLVTLTGGR